MRVDPRGLDEGARLAGEEGVVLALPLLAQDVDREEDQDTDRVVHGKRDEVVHLVVEHRERVEPRADLGVEDIDAQLGLLQSMYIVGYALASVSFGFLVRARPPFQGKEPFFLAVVTLPEGVQIMGNTVDITLEEMKIGLKVKPYWHPLPDGTNMLMWQKDV